MSSNEERRQAAKRKLEDRLERERQAAQKRRRIVLGSTATVVVIALAVAGYFTVTAVQQYVFNKNHARCDYPVAENALAKLPQVADNLTGEQAALANRYKAMMAGAQAKSRTVAAPDSRPDKKGTVDVNFVTSQGTIPMTLDRASAPCNVAAIVDLVKAKYYDNTSCHRMTKSQGSKLSVLQCGDPTGTGGGNPGWSSPDEFPTNLTPVPSSAQEQQLGAPQRVVYPRGSVAIANSYRDQYGGQVSGQNTGSAQFFLVIQDSELPPNYSVVGKVGEAGLTVLDKVYAAGVAPGVQPSDQDQTTGKYTAFQATPGDGPPVLPVTVERASIV